MGKILIGTCSWTDKTLIESGRFYPDWARSAEARLRYYASQFPIVEVDSSYYALPSEQASRLWVERTADGFIFDVKAFRLFTRHPTPPSALPQDIRNALPVGLKEKTAVYQRELPPELVVELWRRFEQALLPLDSAGKLGVVLFQFPPWFSPGNEAREYLLACSQRLGQYPIAVEFRHYAWLDNRNIEKTLGFLRDHNLAFVCVDEPQGFRSSVVPVAAATADIGLVRFHGRNRDTWEKKGISVAERFNYLYTEAELSEWAPKLKELAAKTRQLHVLFNNCHQDKAVANARQLLLMLD
ncbi:MAG: DUF72 domain-containing protein [Dehalococcoidales bacterium]|nr:DUF72 domain-containing protein [Dehalococcoidales bacterium]